MSESALIRKYVLVIEDDSSIRESISIVLDFLKLDSHSVSDGAAALDYLDTAKFLPALILLDLSMPVMDGESFRRRQLEKPELCSIPTVLLSAKPHVEELATSLGISKILIKPFLFEDLVNTLKAFSAL